VKKRLKKDKVKR